MNINNIASNNYCDNIKHIYLLSTLICIDIDDRLIEI